MAREARFAATRAVAITGASKASSPAEGPAGTTEPILKALSAGASEVLLQQMRERSLEGTRARAAALYHSKWCQRSVLTMIALSFASDVLQAELLPEQHSPDGALGRNDDTGFRVTPSDEADVAHTFAYFDLGADIFFFCELAFNVFAHSNDGFRPFLGSALNLQDVFIMLTTALAKAMPDAVIFHLTRHLRVFRVARLFCHVPALCAIVCCVRNALCLLASVFVLKLTVVCAFATIGTHALRQTGPVGHDLFGCFHRSVFTFFQITTADSWSPSVARALTLEMEQNGSESTNTVPVYLFLASSLVSTRVVFVGLVIAVSTTYSSDACACASERARGREEGETKRVRQGRAGAYAKPEHDAFVGPG